MKIMKNTIKLVGIIALITVIGFSMAACSSGGGGGGGGSKSTGTTTGGSTDTAVTFNSVTANGNSTNTTTQLTLIFSQAIPGLSASDITLTGVDGVSKGTLSGSGPTYTLGITVPRGGTLSVRVAKSGYTIGGSPKTVSLNYYSSTGGNTAVTFNSVTANGNSTTTTTQLTLTFSQAIAGLSAADITLSGVASVSKGTLSGSGPNYTLPISGFSAGGTLTVAVAAKSGYTISGSPKTVTIYRSSSGSGSGGGVFGTSHALAVAYGAGKFVAGGESGKMAYSADGMNWTAVSNSTFGSERIFCIIWNGTMFLAGGDYSKMARSTDGISWTAIPNTAFGYDWIMGLAWNGSRFVATGSDGKIAYSTNAEFTSWTKIPSGSGAGTSTFTANYSISAIAYGASKFVAGGHDRMAYSSDGTSWTGISLSSSKVRTILWNGTRFTAGGDSGSIIHSTDGINWTAVYKAWDAFTGVDGIAYSGSRYVAVGSEKIAYSDNGTSWVAASNITNPYLGYWNDVAYGGGKFVAVGHTGVSGKIAYSTNGTSWTGVP